MIFRASVFRESLRGERRFLAILGLLFLLLYGLNLRAVATGDSLAHSFLAESLLRTGDFDLAEQRGGILALSGGQLPYYVTETGGHVRTIFSWFPAVALLPFQAMFPAAWRGDVYASLLAGKIAASVYTFVSALFLYLLLHRRVPRWAARVAMIAWLFATPLWPLSMTYLQHQPFLAFKVAAMFALFGSERTSMHDRPPVQFFVAGLLLGVAVLCRYQTAISAIPSGVVVCIYTKEWRRVLAFCVGGVPAAVAFLLYNDIVNGGALHTGYVVYPWATLTAPFFTTLAALLINPNHGLLVFSPFLIFGVPGIVACVRRRDPLGIACAVSVPPLLILYAVYTGWFGGWTWGYRFLLDMLPELMVFAAFGIGSIAGTAGTVVLAVLLGWSFLVQAVGAFCHDSEWQRVHDLGTTPSQAWLWQIRHGQILYYIQRGTVYIGTHHVQLWHNPFATTGFFTAEDWDGARVAWTSPGDARILFVSRENPPTLHLFAPSGLHQDSAVRITVDGGLPMLVEIPPGTWRDVPLPGVAFQHSALVILHTEPAWQEPGEGGRSLGVALRLEESWR